jgi:NAD(P)-dependent dehydrogenase (short-subunit alcohol dehydrogenase family)
VCWAWGGTATCTWITGLPGCTEHLSRRAGRSSVVQRRKLQLRALIVASGFLHGPQGQPERSLANLDADYLQHVFAINTIGPALVMKHFLPLLAKTGPCKTLPY